MTQYVLFFANDGLHGRELWVTDGVFNVSLVKNINPYGYANFHNVGLAVAKSRDVNGVGTGATRIDVVDQRGAAGGAVRDPQLGPVRAVIGREQRLAVADGGNVRRTGIVGTGARINVHDQLRAGRR